MTQTQQPIEAQTAGRAALEDAVARPAWFKDGHCRGMSVDFFFDPEREDEAKAVCGACPVNATCLAYALYQPDLEGFWGGLSATSRRELREMSFLPTAVPAVESLVSAR